MRQILNNEALITSVIAAVILFYFGDILAAKVLEHSDLIIWLGSHKIDLAYQGADFSLIPTVIVLLVTYIISSLAYMTIGAIVEIASIFQTPVQESTIDAKQSNATTPTDSKDVKSERSEPVLKLSSDINSDGADKKEGS